MKNQKRLILCKETSDTKKEKIEEEFKNIDMKVVSEESVDVQYDVKACQIFTCDGSMVHFDGEEGRILFVLNYPHIESKCLKDGKEKVYNKVVCEIRMPASLFRFTANSIMDEITEYDNLEKKKETLFEFLKNKENQMMFG